MSRRKQPTPGKHSDVREELAEVVAEWRPRYPELTDKPACSHPPAGHRKRIRTTSIARQTGNCGCIVKTDIFPVVSPYDIVAVLSQRPPAGFDSLGRASDNLRSEIQRGES